MIAILAFLVLVFGVSLCLWAFYSALFYRQWLTPLNKVIVITGCDSGIGWQLAKHFHRKGSIVIATVISKQSPGAVRLQNELGFDRLYLLELDLKKKSKIIQVANEIENILQQLKLGNI